MPYGTFTSYDPAPDASGAYRFYRGDDDANPVLFTGPPAAELRDQIDRSNLASSIAPAGATAPTVNLDALDQYGSGLEEPATGPDKSSTAELAAEKERMHRATAIGAAARAEQMPKPASVGRPKAGPQPPAGSKTMMALNAQGDTVVETPSGAIVINERPRTGTPGGTQPTTTTIKGGYEPDQDYLEAQNEANLQIRMGHDIAYEGTQKLLAQQAGELQARVDAQERQAKEQADQQAAIDRGVAEKQDAYDKASAEYKSARVDPGKLGSWAGNPLGGIGLILGTIAANFPGAKHQIPNYAQQILNKRIDDDIRAQEAEIAVKKDAANNALGDLQRKLGSQELARTAMRGILLQQSQDRLSLLQTQAKSTEEAGNYQAWLGENEAALAKAKAQYLREAQGEVTRNMKYMPPTAGTGGGVRFATAEELGKPLALRKQMAEIGKLEAQGEPGKLSAQQKAARADIDAARGFIADYQTTYETTGGGAINRLGAAATQRDKILEGKAKAGAPIVQKALGYMRISPATSEATVNSITGLSEDKTKAQLQAIRDQLDRRERAILAQPGAAEVPQVSTEGIEEEK